MVKADNLIPFESAILKADLVFGKGLNFMVEKQYFHLLCRFNKLSQYFSKLYNPQNGCKVRTPVAPILRENIFSIDFF